jgi:hypothetical protein
MSTLKGIIRNGRVIVIGPTDLPDGTEVEILPVGLSALDDQGQVTPMRSRGPWPPWKRSSRSR